MLSVIAEAKSNSADTSGYPRTKEDLIRQDYEKERKMKERADVLYSSDEEYYKKFPHRNYNQFDGNMTGGAAPLQGGIEVRVQPNQKNHLENEIAVDHIDNDLLKLHDNSKNHHGLIHKGKYAIADYLIENNFSNYKPALIHKYGIDAVENLDMSYSDHYLDTPFAHEHTVFNSVYDIESPFLRNITIDKIKSALEKDFGKNVTNKIGGILFNSNSAPSKRLAKSQDMINFIKANKQALQSNEIIASTSIRFRDSNFHNAIGNADILDVYMDKNGDVSFYVIDTYDFNENSPSPLVQAGRKHQEIGRLKPYFMIYSVKIDKETFNAL